MFLPDLCITPFVNPTGCSRETFHADLLPVDGGVECRLPSGQSMVVEDEGDSRPLVVRVNEEAEKRFNRWEQGNGGVWQVKKGINNPRDYRKLVTDVIATSGVVGEGDVNYWTHRFLEGDSWVDKIFPHWVFLSIQAGLDVNRNEGYKYVPQRPRLITLNPESNEKVASDEVNNCRWKAPVMIGKFFPICGWLDEYDWCIRHDFTLMREGRGLGLGKWSLPGGHASNLLDWSYREYTEEANNITLKSLGNFNPSPIKTITRLRFIAVIDQVVLGSNGILNHFMVNCFLAEMQLPSFIDWILEQCSLGDLVIDHEPTHGDGEGKNNWDIVPVNNDSHEVDVKGKLLQPVERTIFQLYREYPNIY